MPTGQTIASSNSDTLEFVCYANMILTNLMAKPMPKGYTNKCNCWILSLERLLPKIATEAASLDDRSRGSAILGETIPAPEHDTLNPVQVSQFGPLDFAARAYRVYARGSLTSTLLSLPGDSNVVSLVMTSFLIRDYSPLPKKELHTSLQVTDMALGRPGTGGLNYTIQLAPYDCTGCAVCVECLAG